MPNQSLADQIKSCSRMLRPTQFKKCTDCAGSGTIYAANGHAFDCLECDGTGTKPRTHCANCGDPLDRDLECRSCRQAHNMARLEHEHDCRTDERWLRESGQE